MALDFHQQTKRQPFKDFPQPIFKAVPPSSLISIFFQSIPSSQVFSCSTQSPWVPEWPVDFPTLILGVFQTPTVTKCFCIFNGGSMWNQPKERNHFVKIKIIPIPQYSILSAKIYNMPGMLLWLPLLICGRHWYCPIPGLGPWYCGQSNPWEEVTWRTYSGWQFEDIHPIMTQETWQPKYDTAHPFHPPGRNVPICGKLLHNILWLTSYFWIQILRETAYIPRE